MSSSTFIGNPEIMVAGPPPPPPPPPPITGQLPTMRINTVENATMKRPQVGSNDVYEPPAAIQNAMLTKDKKPFTYTPGMGGKLDLSQIRSPRMARRVAKNANDEGIEGPPKSAVDSKPLPAVSVAPNLFVQPQVAVPVFPTNISPQPHINRTTQPPLINRTPSNAVDKQADTSKNIAKIDTKIVPITVTSSQSSQSSTPESPNTPTQITLAKAPTPWLQNRNKPQEELPEWAKRANVKVASGSPESPTSPPVYAQSQQSPPQRSLVKQKEQEQQPIQSSPQYQCQPKLQTTQQNQPPRQQRQNIDPATFQRANSQAQQHASERVIPIRIEDRPSVFDAKREPGHHQFKQSPTLHHQQRWGQVQPMQHPPENRIYNRPQDQEQYQTHVASLSQPEQSVGTYIIPVVVEGNDKKTTNIGNNTIGRAPKVLQQRASVPAQQHEVGPIQSRSFRVLQKITDTDAANDVGTEQIRKMELSEDEKELMNKFKEQVDHETYLHQEEDPRYRGAAIPSRAFRFLQNMTDSSDASVTCITPRNVQNVSNKKQNRNSKSFEETQANLPPSEQQVQEPKKYMGSAIPSRSFRILQAMTAPETIATQENRQADYNYRTENNLPGNQQGVFLSPPVPFCYPEGWWGYYPVRYNALPDQTANDADKHSFPPYVYPPRPPCDGNAYIGYEPFYPLYNQNFEDLARMKAACESNLSNQYDGETACSHSDYHENVRRPHSDENDCNDDARDSLIIDSSFSRSDQRFAKNDLANEAGSAVLPNEINHLDAQSSGIFNSKYANENGNNEKNSIITAMNIVDEEDGTSSNSKNVGFFKNIETLGKTFGPHINVPNYTYIDTSDSSASSDSDKSSESDDSDDSDESSDSNSDNEHLSDSCKKNLSHDTTSNNTSSDSDSESYVTYSTGLNSYEKLERDLQGSAISLDDNSADIAASFSTCSTSAGNHERLLDDGSSTRSEKICFRGDRREYAGHDALERELDVSTRAMTKGCKEDCTDGRRNLDPFSAETSLNDREPNTEQCDRECLVENPTIDTVPHRLDVIYENAERPDSESPYYDRKRNISEPNEIPLDATDDPPDDSETTMVSVSLPLRFKFFVSENNEDIATVIVGDSKIRAEKSRRSKDECSTQDDKIDDVCVNFHVGNDTSVKFTVKRPASSDSTRDAGDAGDARSARNEDTEAAIPHDHTVNFTLRKDATRENESSCEEHAKVELAVTTRENDGTNSSGSADEYIVSESATVAQDALLADKNCDNVAESAYDRFNSLDSTIVEPKIAVSEYSCVQDDSEASGIGAVNASSDDQTDRGNCAIVHHEDDRYDLEIRSVNIRGTLSVQDSREDTDDEDSGVTSDLSRMISEVDTDSECASTRNLKKYQRTQTHSRLFRLLNDDSVLSDCSKAESSSKKEHLSLPLKTNVFNYDDNYCSNYSSGLTSPEYSPIYEQSWRRFHDATNTSVASSPNIKIDHLANQPEQVVHKDDPYFRTWKNPKLSYPSEHYAVPSLAFKILDSKMPSWTYRVNVLCPRVKSAKNVPQTILTRESARSSQTGKINEALIAAPSVPTSTANAKTNYC